MDVPITTCRLRPSRALAVLYALTHVAALCGVVALPGGWPVRVAATAGVIVHLGWALRHVAWRRTRSAPVWIGWSHDDVFVIEQRDGTRVVARLAGPALVHPWLVAMRLQPNGMRGWARHSLAIPCDACTAEEHRSLRVALRHLARPEAS